MKHNTMEEVCRQVVYRVADRPGGHPDRKFEPKLQIVAYAKLCCENTLDLKVDETHTLRFRSLKEFRD